MAGNLQGQLTQFFQEGQQLFNTLKAQVEEVKGREDQRIAKELQRVAQSSTGGLNNIFQEATQKLMGRLQQMGGLQSGPLGAMMQKVQNAVGGLVNNNVINQAQSMMSGQLNNLISQATGKLGGIMSQAAGPLSSVTSQLQEQLQKFTNSGILGNSTPANSNAGTGTGASALGGLGGGIINAGPEMLLKMLQQGMGATIAASPQALFAPLQELQQDLIGSVRDVVGSSSSMLAGLDHAASQFSSAGLPNILNFNPQAMLSEVTNFQQQATSIADSALLSAGELVNGGHFSSSNFSSLQQQLVSVASNAAGMPNIDLARRASGVRNVLNFDANLLPQINNFAAARDAATGFVDNLQNLDLNIPGNPLSGQFATMLDNAQNTFDTAAANLTPVVNQLEQLVSGGATAFSNAVHRVDARAQIAALPQLPGPVGPNAALMLNREISNVAMNAVPQLQNVLDSATAATANIDFFNGSNPANILNQAHASFDAAGTQAAASLRSIANQADLQGMATSTMADMNNLRGQFNNYLAGGVEGQAIQDQITALKPQVEQLRDSGQQMLDDLKTLEVPGREALNNIRSAVKNSGLDNMWKAAKKGDFKSALTMSWDSAQVEAAIRKSAQDFGAKISEKAELLDADMETINSHINTLQNQVKIAGKKLENTANNFRTRAERLVNQSNIRSNAKRRFDNAMKVLGGEFEKLKGKKLFG